MNSFQKLKFRQLSKIGCKLGATFGENVYLCTQLNVYDTLKTSAAVKELRSQYMEERGFVVHEPSISEQTHITITRFWEILNQWLRVD